MPKAAEREPALCGVCPYCITANRLNSVNMNVLATSKLVGFLLDNCPTLLYMWM